ncbi:GntR family transcriptional regulator of bglA [Lactobacillus colini]|uniref:GntR family transcriptional regulator of bglA n=1 Tax=Lactobacillus colini TaxID=1819254 RepID=A0ABS4MDE6_9LACO|nr:GntR family transcriptional regulator [Lactobacillus colini]MBP2057361.1 GntR family transcriptional regulator of bglA [Lactobacillus colini]
MKKYQLVADKIRQAIKKNNLKRGDKLPKIKDLVDEFGVSKATVLQALALLAKQGTVYKIQGSGIFVREPADLEGYMSLLTNRGLTGVVDNISTEVISIDELDEPPEKAKKYFEDEDLRCYCLKRLRKTNDKPFVLEESYYLKKYVPFISKEIAQGSMFKYISEGLNEEIRFSDKFMWVEKLNECVANKLELKAGDPALIVNDLYYMGNGKIFDVSFLTYNYQNSKFFDQSSDEII